MLVAAAAPPHYPVLPLSLNSLDLASVRLLSPRDSQILPNQFAGAEEPVQVTHPSSRRSSMKILSFMLFRSSRSVVEPSWGRSGTFVAFGVSSFILAP